MNAPATPEEADMLAAEYALGVLDAGEHEFAAQLLRKDASFAARVALWEAQLAPMADDIAPVPAPNLMPKINARLFGTARHGWRKFLPQGGWRGVLSAALGTGAMAALSVIAIALLLQFSGDVGRPLQTATLVAEGSAVQFQASLEGDIVTITQTAGMVAPIGRSYELWLIDGDTAPLSLGLITASLSLTLPQANPGFVLAVTDEPFGGGPGGIPTGQIIALGSFSEG